MMVTHAHLSAPAACFAVESCQQFDGCKKFIICCGLLVFNMSLASVKSITLSSDNKSPTEASQSGFFVCDLVFGN